MLKDMEMCYRSFRSPVEQWKKTFQKVFEPMDQQNVWRRNNEHSLKRTPCLQWSLAVVQWFSMAALLPLALETCTGKIVSIKYQGILGENIMLSVRKLKLRCQWTFQQDNDPWFPKTLVLEVLEDSSVSQPPDFKPTENLKWNLKKEIAEWKNIIELKVIAHEGWDKIPQEHFQKLVSGYVLHLQEVITVNLWSKY